MTRSNAHRPAAAPHMSAGEWGALLLLGLIWGSSFSLMKISVTVVPPLTLVLCRTGVAATMLYVWLRMRGRTLPRDPALWKQFAVMGFINNVVPISLIVWAHTQIPSSLGGILNATTPLWAIILAFLLSTGEATANRIAGVILGFAGVIVLIGWETESGGALFLLGEMAVIVASLFYAAASFYGRRFSALPPSVSSFCQLISTTIMMIPVCLLVDRPWTLPAPGAGIMLAVAFLGIVCTGVAYLLYFHLLRRIGSTNITLVTFIIPVNALFIGMVFLGERLGLSDLGGMILIMAGLAVIDGRILPGRKQVRPSRP